MTYQGIEQFDVDHHAHRLYEFLQEINHWRDICDHTNTIGYLNVSHSIESVKMTTYRYDESVVWCGQAYDFEDKRSDTLEKMYTSLTKFIYTFTAYESLVSELHNGQKIRGSKTSKIRDLLYECRSKPVFHDEDLRDFHSFCVTMFRDRHEELKSYYNDSQKHKLSATNKGIVLIAEIRNDFLHGSTFQDSYSEDAVEDKIFIGMTSSARRVILNTMQMLIGVRYAAINSEMEFFKSCMHDEDYNPKFHEALLTMAAYKETNFMNDLNI